jgi:hypothetical protein
MSFAESTSLSKKCWANYTGFSVLMAKPFGRKNKISKFHNFFL